MRREPVLLAGTGRVASLAVSDLISSAANPVARRIRRLAERKHRRKEGAFVAEGIQPVWRAVEAGWEIDTFVIAPELLPARAAEMVAAQEARGAQVARLSTELFIRVSEREGPSGLLAIIRSRSVSLVRLGIPADATFAVLDRVANPGNLGTIIRTVDAAGGAGVIVIGDAADPYAPAAVRASMGSVFSIAVSHAQNPGEFLSWARVAGVQIIATSGIAAQAHWNIDYRPPLAVLLGSEREGLPAELLAAADECVRIPMTGTAESLNLAVAAGVMLYEVQRHKLA